MADGNLSGAARTLHASVIVGSGEPVRFRLTYAVPRTSEGAARTEEFEGPQTIVLTRPDAHPLGVPWAESRRDASSDPEGLSLRVHDRALTAVYSMGTFRDADCAEGASPVASHAWRVANETQVILFVAVGSSDDCGAASPPHTPRVIVHTPALPVGPATVRLVTVRSCYCPPVTGWREAEQNVTVTA